MGYSYGVPKAVGFSGAQVVDANPLTSPWGVEAAVWQFTQYTPMGPSQAQNGMKYPGYQWLVNTYVEFESFGLTVHRSPIREISSSVCLPPEKIALVRSLWMDVGRPVESAPDFQIKVFAPIGVGFFWAPRQVIWRFDGES